jgi:hypothetical protein
MSSVCGKSNLSITATGAVDRDRAGNWRCQVRLHHNEDIKSFDKVVRCGTYYYLPSYLKDMPRDSSNGVQLLSLGWCLQECLLSTTKELIKKCYNNSSSETSIHESLDISLTTTPILKETILHRALKLGCEQVFALPINPQQGYSRSNFWSCKVYPYQHWRRKCSWDVARRS